MKDLFFFFSAAVQKLSLRKFVYTPTCMFIFEFAVVYFQG